MPGKLIDRQVDYDGDSQQTSFDTIGVADATDYATWLTQMQTFTGQLAALTIGGNGGRSLVAVEEDATDAAASNPVAQKSTQMIIEYEDDNSLKPYKIRVGMPDLTLANAWIRSGGLTVLDPSTATYADFVTAFEDVVRHIDETGTAQTVSVQSIYIRE
jgi:hypothetical protein